MKRKIIRIDERKCNGCGQCVPSCAEGALQIVNGKAKLVADVYCDGLGACLGECPQGAITIVERDAEAFDEEAARQHVTRQRPQGAPIAKHHGCPGAAVQNLRLNVISKAPTKVVPKTPGNPLSFLAGDDEAEESPLGNWPIQLGLVPPHTPFLQDADLVLVADCAAFAVKDFQGLLRRRPLLIGCPKLDDGQSYVDKLAEILRVANVRRLTVVHMEVPCCTGLVRIAQAARERACSDVPLEEITISVRGEILSSGGVANG